jgi:hemerythrin-like domain-containing protein
MLICNQNILTRITQYINKPENKINKEDKERYDRISNYIKLGDNMISQYHNNQVIIPSGKILKVWNDDNLAPKIYTCGIHTPH